MEVVSRLPRPTDPAALDRLLEAQKLLCAKFVSEEDCLQAVTLLEELAASEDSGGYDYFPALLTLASLSTTGFEPAIDVNQGKAAGLYLQFLGHERSSELSAELLEDAATQLCNIVREDKSGFTKSEQTRLEELADGAFAGVVPFVATWTRFAAHELDRQLREASEDPQERERRLARESAREALKAEEITRQRQLTDDALARSEELQLEGNDLCRQGQLPGNSKAGALLSRALDLYGSAISVLSECLALGLTLVPEEANTVRRRRSTLQSNAAQVCLSRRDYPEARRLAKAALKDDPENSKSCFRLARAEIELQEWASAASTVDEALGRSQGKSKSEEADANKLELWKLAEEVSKALPDWKWSSSKPLPRNEAEDFEKRLIGFWKYQGGKYEIKVEPWGALTFSEETTKIDLMRKSKLTWRGEFEQIPGMALVLSYEPGCDLLTTKFLPPEEGLSDEQKWKGPTTFSASRVKSPPPVPEAPEEPIAAARPAPASPSPLPQVPVHIGQRVECRDPGQQWEVGTVTSISPLEVRKDSLIGSLGGDSFSWAEVRPLQVAPAPLQAPSLADDAPRILWLSGPDDLCGRYELVPENFQSDRPVYRRVASLSETEPAVGCVLFLWYRGGNWGVTKAINTSLLVAPFLARCGDGSGQSRHPLDIRRPRWQVRRGRGQEDLDPSFSLAAEAPAASVAEGGYPEPDSETARPSSVSSDCPEAEASPQGAQAELSELD